MRAVDALLLAYDHATAHRWESLASVLEGVGSEEAAWSAPPYADAEREDGWPAPGSIHWHVAHLAHCKRHYVLFLTQRDRAGRPPAPPYVPAPGFAAEREALAAAHAELRAAIATLTDTDLDARVGNAMTVAEFVAMFTRHDAWHAAQIAVARRLFRTRA